jgi:2-phospho-L-lactate guanylyltransferase
MWLIIPVKNFVNAKQRLCDYLDNGERAGLYRSMLEDVLCSVQQVEKLDGVSLVTCDPEAIRIANDCGISVMLEPENRSHTDAIQLAVENLVRTGIESMMTLPGDIPLVTPVEINSLIDAHAKKRGPAFSISPSHDFMGSNAVVCSPPDIIPLQFGSNSFYPHLDAAKRFGIDPTVVSLPGISLDIDTPEDLRMLISRQALTPSPTRTQRFLDKRNISARLCADPSVLDPRI